MRTQAFLVVNPRSGDEEPTGEVLAAAARERGVEVHLLHKGEDPGEAARSAGAEILGMAGGDGSLAAVASVALATGAAFVCVPFGTRNHFARDIGLERDDPFAALAALTDGGERRIDAGRVGGRLFLNNVSLGVYAGLVHRREHHRRRGEALARVRGLMQVARHESLPGALRLLVPERTGERVTIGGVVHENSRATEEEQEAAQEGTRQQQEDSMRYPGHDDPDAQRDAAHREDEE